MQAHIAEASRHEPDSASGIGHNGAPSCRKTLPILLARPRGLVSKSHLEKLRMTGQGPPYRKLGRKVIYYWPDVVKWLDARIRHSTSEEA